MKTFHSLALAALVIFFSAAVPAAAELAPVAVAARLQQTYDRTTTLSADFKQLTSMPMQRRERRGSGTMVLQKPGRIRWNYLTPDFQVLVSDGTTVSMYFAKNQQMMIMDATRYLASDVTYAFFVGNGKIVDDFDVLPPEAAPPLEGGTYCIKLVPKKNHPQLQYLHLWVDSDTWLVTRIQLVDQLNTVTDLSFANITTNRPVPAETFTFTPPPDTEIIQQ